MIRAALMLFFFSMSDAEALMLIHHDIDIPLYFMSYITSAGDIIRAKISLI